MKRLFRLLVILIIALPLATWGAHHYIQKKTGRSFLDPVWIPYKTRYYLKRMHHANAFVAAKAFGQINNLYFTKWMAYNLILEYAQDPAPLTFLIQRSEIAVKGKADSAKTFSAHRKPVYYKAERVYCRTIGEAIRSLAYNEGNWKTDYWGDWDAWWKANQGYYGR